MFTRIYVFLKIDNKKVRDPIR